MMGLFHLVASLLLSAEATEAFAPQWGTMRASVWNNQVTSFATRRTHFASCCSISALKTSSSLKAGAARGQTAIAGKIMPFLSNFRMNDKKMKKISEAVSPNLDPAGLFLLLIIGWAVLPISCKVFTLMQKRHEANEERDKERLEGSEQSTWARLVKALALPSYKRRMNFKDSLVFQVGNHLSQLGKLGTMVYTVDILAILFREIGFVKFAKNVQKTFPPASFTVWLVWRLNIFKRYLLSKRLRRPMDNLGRGEAYDTILSLLLFAITGLALLVKLHRQETRRG
jgi:hypothetical protein